MNKRIMLMLILVINTVFASVAAFGQEKNIDSTTTYSVLIVLTHVDDYVSIAPLIAKYSAEGNKVYYAIFNGVLDSASLEPGGKKRGELLCGARVLGIQEPFITIGPTGEGIAVTAKLANRTIELINQIKPDVIITWGPEGLTGHPRHILVGNIVTRIFQQQSLLVHKPRKLYYITYPQSLIINTNNNPFGRIANEDGPFGTVNENFITTEIDGGNYLQQTRAAIACHSLPKGALNKKWQDAWYERLAITLGGKVFLRLVFPVTERKETDIFTGL